MGGGWDEGKEASIAVQPVGPLGMTTIPVLGDFALGTLFFLFFSFTRVRRRRKHVFFSSHGGVVMRMLFFFFASLGGMWDTVLLLLLLVRGVEQRNGPKMAIDQYQMKALPTHRTIRVEARTPRVPTNDNHPTTSSSWGWCWRQKRRRRRRGRRMRSTR